MLKFDKGQICDIIHVSGLLIILRKIILNEK